MKYTYKEYDRLIHLPLEQKVAWSEKAILQAIRESKNPSVSCSWGKDSVVMLHLIRKFCKNTIVMFANTLCEYPETYAYRDKMLKTEFEGCNYVETKPIKDFWSCVKEYGYPHNRGTGEDKRRTPKCCMYLKEKPLEEKQKELKVDLVYIGIQATESMNRRLVFLRLGELYKKKSGLWHCLPLAIWTNKDVFEYAKRNKIEMNSIYKKMDRNGCMFCTGFKNWKQVMAKYNKKLYAKILNEKEGQQTINKDCNY